MDLPNRFHMLFYIRQGREVSWPMSSNNDRAYNTEQAKLLVQGVETYSGAIEEKARHAATGGVSAQANLQALARAILEDAQELQSSIARSITKARKSAG